ncbi:hypothetical protein J0871_17055 [Salegentibacter sp. BDJ18]|uniref:hypothetical protein n=1 Tax=Salegentibacter sp. BDJ18 TaxID=2816376 RepID=UPI001AAE8956|nr:hypothetical protein [Salegentibacter sp. BDJ18]MBO2546128.1 hypothetical protein [Salegentibacter sp. BDJ18]
MIFKFTTDQFDLDLYGKNLNIVKENHWFTDQFFSQYSFPFQFNIEDDLNTKLGFITDFSSSNSRKTFDGYLQLFGEEHEAKLIIGRCQGKMVQGKIKFGFEDFPNFEKKLSELPLHKEDFVGTIQDFAANIVNQTWPAVDYNFPAVITDAIDTNSEQWQYFEGLINNYQAGVFIENEYDEVNDEQVNRNLMQPMPYLLHVLKQGFSDAGFNLKGDILEDPELKEALLVVLSDYYSNISADGQEFEMLADEYDEVYLMGPAAPGWSDGVQAGIYNAEIQLLEPGIYNISGSAILRVDGTIAGSQIKINDEVIWQDLQIYNEYREFYSNIDRNFEISVAQGSASLKFFSEQMAYAIIDESQDPKAMIFDVTITKVAGYDANGELIPALITPEKIDLTKCVPDITFGELVKVIKNWRNYDLNISGNDAIMNKIQNEMEAGEIISLEEFEVKEPIREFYEDKSFLLQFQEQNSDDYSFDKIFVDNAGARTSSFVKDEETSEITINGIPLPQKQQGPFFTAHLYTENASLVALALFGGLANATNATKDPKNLLIPAIYRSDYEIWIDFRIHSEGTEWTFICDAEKAAEIKKKSRIYAYGKYHIIRRVSKKNQTLDLWEITVEQDGRH